MKNKKITTIIIVMALALILIGVILVYNKEKNHTLEIDKDYRDLSTESLKEDQVFNNIKYTQNHLSTTDSTNYATFTSVVFNETGVDIKDKHLEIDFFDDSGKLLGTMESTIEMLKQGESTVIFGIIMQDISTATNFKVREVLK